MWCTRPRLILWSNIYSLSVGCHLRTTWSTVAFPSWEICCGHAALLQAVELARTEVPLGLSYSSLVLTSWPDDHGEFVVLELVR